MHKNILFIDDDPAILDALEWTFADEPYDCLTSKTAEEALHIMDENEIAVVISDQRMPEMSGIDFLKKIKHQWPATIRILMTAYQEMNIIMNAVNKGQVYNLIFKPWDEEELKKIIKAAVDDYTWKSTNFFSRKLVNTASELIEANQTLEKKNQFLLARLQQAQKMETLGSMASGIAHDFNNILLVIHGLINVTMVENVLSPKMTSHLNIALEATERGKDLTTQILTFSNTGDGSNKPVRLSQIIMEVLEFIKTVLPPNIQIHQDIDDCSDKIQLQATKIYQILMNLCSNAFDSMKDRKGIVRISLTRVTFDQMKQVKQIKLIPGKYFCLTVSDSGIGIDEKNLEKIFDPYFTTKQGSGGTGLGLALTNQIVQECGGRVSVSSEVDKGTIFSVFFPIFEESME